MIIDNERTDCRPAVRRSLPVRVREAIEEQILTGGLREGDQIVEYQLARQMGISQTPVREALRTLERDGLVVTLPHRGTFVRRVTRREAAERYSLGMELEAFAARLAMPKLLEDDFRRLEQIIDEMAAAADTARRELQELQELQEHQEHQGPAAPAPHAEDVAFARSVELNVAFHRYLVERAEHEHLLRAWLSVNPLNWRFVTYTRLLNPDPVELAERHRSLLAAYRTGDQVLAAAVIRQHIWEVAEQVLPNIPDEPAHSLSAPNLPRAPRNGNGAARLNGTASSRTG
ncbi:MAG: GntR family transcriptional regulator [Chloroflexi bacterium]|nr:GntR family transcriptional regulator [Chloroflexota bacterium]